MRENSPVDQAYSYIKKLIVTKTLYPGNRIVEEDISRETGISRTPIRTALLRLSYEGMVEQQPNRGSFVAKPSMTDLDQVYELRVLLEVGAFRAAIRHRSEESVSWMRNVLDQQADLEKHFNMVEYASLNREFHWIIALEARNPYYEKYLTSYTTRYPPICCFGTAPPTVAALWRSTSGFTRRSVTRMRNGVLPR